jgi:uncharacterized protein YecE (DUF72 family)
VLWQLPENVAFDAEVLEAFFALLPRTTGQAAALAKDHDEKVKEGRSLTTALDDRRIRHALEFRSPTFVTEEAYDLLRRHDVACVLADTAGRWPKVEQVTSDFMYLRLHGDKELYASGYSASALEDWATKCRGWASDGLDVYAYFDNDIKGYAPYDAMKLTALLGRAG